MMIVNDTDTDTMRNDKHLTNMVYEWDYIPVLANYAVNLPSDDQHEGITPEWCRETFFKLVVDDFIDPEGILNSIVDYAVMSINWYRVSEAVKSHIQSNT